MKQDASAAFLARSESEQLQYVAKRSARELRPVGELVCRCRWNPKRHQYGLDATHIDKGARNGVFVPCKHEPVLALTVLAAILEKLWPREYREPALDRPSDAVTKEQCLQLRIARASRGLALWHPLDARQSQGGGLLDAFGVKARRTRNGVAVEMGVVRMQGKMAG